MERTGNSHKLSIFLCHSSGDKLTVREIHKRLRGDGFEPWLDEVDLLPGQPWEEEIRRAVRNTDVVIVCLSRSSVSKSGYVQKEIKLALDVADEQPEGAIFLIPLKLQECKSPEQLDRWHRVNFYEDGGYERLMKSLQRRAATLGKTVKPSANIADRSTSSVSLWKFISALLVVGLVVNFFLASPASSPTLGFDLRPDGIEICNTNDDPIAQLKEYLTAYKIDKKQKTIGRKLKEVDVSDLVCDLAKNPYCKLEPGQLTTILNSKLFSKIELTGLGKLSNPDEIIVWVLTITFHPATYVIRSGKQELDINQKEEFKIRPFLAPDNNGQKTTYSVPFQEKTNSIYYEEVAYPLAGIEKRGV